MKIEVEYLFERDAINYLSSVYKFKWSKHGRKGLEDRIARYLPESFYNGVRKAKSENEVRQLIKEYLQNNYKVNLKLAKEVSNNLKKTWNLYGKKIEKELEVVFNEKFPFKKLNIYLTTIPISPYKYPDWILVYINLATEKQLNVIKHELNHFMFHHYYSYLEEEIGKDQFQSLKTNNMPSSSFNMLLPESPCA